jgi:hypothetical protein
MIQTRRKTADFIKAIRGKTAPGVQLRNRPIRLITELPQPATAKGCFDLTDYPSQHGSNATARVFKQTQQPSIERANPEKRKS